MEGTHLVRSTAPATSFYRSSSPARFPSMPTMRTERGDSVAISEPARRASRTGTVATRNAEPAVRMSLVERVRDEIAAGTYLTESRLDEALDSLLNDLA